MINDEGRLIRNLYCMLAYAFSALRREQGTERADGEEFENIQDLAAGMLAYGLSRRLQAGLMHSYIPQQEELTSLRGRLDMGGTMRLRANRRIDLACEFDEFSPDNIYNRIFKATALHLLRAPAASRPTAARCAELHRLLPLLAGIGDTDPARIPWKRLQPPPHNPPYAQLLFFCRLVWEHQLLSPCGGGAASMPIFRDKDAMSRIYELFVLNYFRRHHPHCNAHSTRMSRSAGSSAADSAAPLPSYVPGLVTDITLRHGDKALIIDTKYYRKDTQSRYDSEQLISSHLNQIFAYTYHYARLHPGVQVEGMLLYARTETGTPPISDFPMGEWNFHTRVLDLNTPFADIAATLDAIAASLL